MPDRQRFRRTTGGGQALEDRRDQPDARDLSTSRSELARHLTVIGSKRSDSKRLRAEAATEAAAWVRVAVGAGTSIATIAHMTNMTRQAVYDLLAAEQAKSRFGDENYRRRLGRILDQDDE